MNVAITKEDLERQAAKLGSEFTTLRQALRDKGAKHFQRPLGLGAVVVFAAYFYVFKATSEIKGRVDAELATVQATNQYAEQYKDLKARLDGFQSRLPRTSNPERWIENSVRNSLREEGIVPLNISTPKDLIVEELRFISITVSCQASYRQIASWISRLERDKRLMYIESLKLKKDDTRIGENTAEVKVTTVVPKGEGGGGGGEAAGGGTE